MEKKELESEFRMYKEAADDLRRYNGDSEAIKRVEEKRQRIGNILNAYGPAGKVKRSFFA